MIQFRRGSTASWKKLKTPLADGQPGYDKDKHKIKVGDGKKLWDKLPYASITEEEVLDSEINAKLRVKEDPESLAIITYGTAGPDKNTVGKLYLQQYDTAAEVDYVVETGVNGIWTYRKWRSGIAECWGVTTVSTAVNSALDNNTMYKNTKSMSNIAYPFTFKAIPCESASVQSVNNIIWLAGNGQNSTSKSGTYAIVSPYSYENASYKITLQVMGRWK